MGENFGKFGDTNLANLVIRICQSFTRQLLVAYEIVIEAGLKFAKVYFANCNLPCNSPNSPPPPSPKSSLYMLYYGSN